MAHDPDLILTIKGADAFSSEAIFFPHNKSRRVPNDDEEEDGDRSPTPSSREVTPDLDESVFEPSRLELRFDQPLPNVDVGFVFGSDPKACDVVVGHRALGISGRHFSINFDPAGRLVLKAISRRGVAVSYDGCGSDQRRKEDFPWILFPGRKIKVHVRDQKKYVFALEVPEIPELDVVREQRLKSYFSGRQTQQNAFTPVGHIAGKPVYIERECLGSGCYGTVYNAVNASTGDPVAVKRFKAETKSENEVKIMKSVFHEHIVQYIDFIDGPEPGLAMEYLPLGNLETHHLTSNESHVLFIQMLRAVEYLHSAGITHRDIKPANILVQQRGIGVEEFRAKLSDFGFAKSSDNLASFCGSDLFTAPEIWKAMMARSPTKYTNAVDIWSLGVVMLNLFRGLPAPASSNSSKSGGPRKEKDRVRSKVSRRLGWCWQIVDDAVELWKGKRDVSLFFILTKMLVVTDTERLGASECLRIYSERLHPQPRHDVVLREVSDLGITEEPSQMLSRANTSCSSQQQGQLTRMASQLCHDMIQKGATIPDENDNELMFMSMKPQETNVDALLPSLSEIFGTPGPGKRKYTEHGDTRHEVSTQCFRVGNAEHREPAGLALYYPDAMPTAIASLLGSLYAELKPADEDAAPSVGKWALDFSEPWTLHTAWRSCLAHPSIPQAATYAEALGIRQFRMYQQDGKIEIMADTDDARFRLANIEDFKDRSIVEVEHTLLIGLVEQVCNILDDKGDVKNFKRPRDDSDTDSARKHKSLKREPSPSPRAIQECTIKQHTVHFSGADSKICLDDLARIKGYTSKWTARQLDSLSVDLKESCEFGTLVDFTSALPIIRKLGLKKVVCDATGLSDLPPARQVFRGKKYTYTRMNGNVVHLQHCCCGTEKKVNASHLIRAAGKGRNARNKAFEACGITDEDIEQLPPHPKAQGAYVSYAKGRKLCEYLGLEVPDAIREREEESEGGPQEQQHADQRDDEGDEDRERPPLVGSPKEAYPKQKARSPLPPNKPTLSDLLSPRLFCYQHRNRAVNGDDHSSSRRTHWSSTRSHLSETRPDYAVPSSVGAPLDGLQMSEPSLFGSS